jgi:hypothetical protein
MNTQVISQLIAAAMILLAGPAVIVILAFNKANL